MSREFTGSEGMQEKLSHYARRVAEKGLAAGAGGNLSVCVDNTVWISRSGIALEDMRPGDFAPVDLRTGRPLRRDIRPSSETGTHLAIYRARDDIRAVVHVHPPFVTGLASAGVDFSTFTFEAVLDLGPVDILPLVPPGSSELAERVGRSAGVGLALGVAETAGTGPCPVQAVRTKGRRNRPSMLILGFIVFPPRALHPAGGPTARG